MNHMPCKAELVALYVDGRKSPEEIGRMFERTGRQVRNWLAAYGVPRLGPAHLRTGKPATWRIGAKATAATRARISQALTGRVPVNKGAGSVTFQCEVCGTEVNDKPYRKRRVCSAECRNELGTMLRGCRHWNFKGASAGFRQRERSYAEYREWRIGVLSGAGYRCEKCGKVGGRLTAHHKDSFSAHPERRFDLSNGACLCWECHWSFHRAYGHKKTTLEQYMEWIA